MMTKKRNCALLPVGGGARESEVYEYRKTSRDGIGKFYMRSEISCRSSTSWFSAARSCGSGNQRILRGMNLGTASW